MSGRVVIVTGANSGIGLKAAEYLCERGDNVILACRNEERGQAAVDKIKAKNPQAIAHFMQLDLASVESIRKFVDEFHATGKKLHVLVNNAGIADGFKSTKRQTTSDGFEMTIGTNHLGPFLLTNLLLDDLKKTGTDTGDARVIIVSSLVHDKTTLGKRYTISDMNLDDVHYVTPGRYSGVQAYKDSKAYNIMFMRMLAKDLEGTGVTVNAICPGFIPSTGLLRNSNGAVRFVMKYVVGTVLRPMMKQVKTIDSGANIIYVLSDEVKFKGVTGKFFSDLEDTESSEETRDQDKIDKLWQLSGGYLKMDGFEPLEVPEPPPEPEPETKKEETKDEANEEKTDDEKKEADEKKEDVEKNCEKKEDDKKDDEILDEKDAKKIED